MKKILTIIAFTFSASTMAQTLSQADILKEINGIMAYNATILGYAINCEINKQDVETVKSQFVSIFEQIPLSIEEKQAAQKSFFDTLEIAKQKGPRNSNMNCSTFTIEFNKILTTVKTGRVVE